VWQWLCYDDGDEEDLWTRWYRGVDDAVQGKHDTIIEYLEVRSAGEWREPHTKKIENDIIEVRIHGNVQHRLFGFFGPKQGEFTFVLPCIHKQNVYTPKGAKKTAAKRKLAIEAGEANVRRCKRPQKTEDSE
jgi:phage-related protein